MNQRGGDQELRVGGLPLSAKFTLSMSIALAAVMAAAAFLLVSASGAIMQGAFERKLAETLKLTVRELRSGNYEQAREQVTAYGDVWRFDVVYGTEDGRRIPGNVYEYRDPQQPKERWRMMLVPKLADETGRGFIGLILGITLAVVLVGALVAFVVASQVSKPVEGLVDDIRQIARGDFRRRSRVKAGGEIALLARSINRMAEGLEEAQEAQLELSMREREMAVAEEVREALHPDRAPQIAGYALAAKHIGSPHPGGDFHDFVELADGRVGLLVCGVSGRGVPGALVGATARSYLRSELAGASSVETALVKVNGFLSRDVRRGMFVTAMYVLLDPASSSAEVACAGHKVPLLRIGGADGKLRAVQPEGIALGLDRGSVFERTLKVQRLQLEPRDRLVLANTGALAVLDAEGKELGEKGFYRLVLAHARKAPAAMLEGLEQGFYEHAGEEPLPSDISIVTVAREA